MKWETEKNIEKMCILKKITYISRYFLDLDTEHSRLSAWWPQRYRQPDNLTQFSKSRLQMHCLCTMWSAATATHTMHTAYQHSSSSCFPLRPCGHTTLFRKNGMMARLTVAALFFLAGFLHVGSSISLQLHM